MNTISGYALMGALSILVAVAIPWVWQWWRQAAEAQRRAVVREAVRWAVELAEWLYVHPKSGSEKLAWATAALRTRFPGLNEAVLHGLIEQAVQHLNARKAAAGPERSNGVPRHE